MNTQTRVEWSERRHNDHFFLITATETAGGWKIVEQEPGDQRGYEASADIARRSERIARYAKRSFRRGSIQSNSRIRLTALGDDVFLIENLRRHKRHTATLQHGVATVDVRIEACYEMSPSHRNPAAHLA
jgi:hypothetical protein